MGGNDDEMMQKRSKREGQVNAETGLAREAGSDETRRT